MRAILGTLMLLAGLVVPCAAAQSTEDATGAGTGIWVPIGNMTTARQGAMTELPPQPAVAIPLQGLKTFNGTQVTVRDYGSNLGNFGSRDFTITFSISTTYNLATTMNIIRSCGRIIRRHARSSLAPPACHKEVGPSCATSCLS